MSNEQMAFQGFFDPPTFAPPPPKVFRHGPADAETWVKRPRDWYDDWIVIPEDKYAELTQAAKDRVKLKSTNKKIDKSRPDWVLNLQGDSSEYMGCWRFDVEFIMRIHHGPDQGFDFMWRNYEMNVKTCRTYGKGPPQPRPSSFEKGDYVVCVEFYDRNDFRKGRVIGVCPTKGISDLLVPAREEVPSWTGWALPQRNLIDIEEFLK
jgi:hypothetical protein